MAIQLEQRAVVFDEDGQTRKQIVQALEHFELGVSPVQNFDAFKSEIKPSMGLVVLDLMSGEVDVVEVIRYLSTIRFRGRLVLVSSADQSVLDAAMKLARLSGVSVTGTIQKPFSTLTLQRHVAQFVHPQINATSRAGPLAETEIIDLLKSGALVAHYQPKVDLDSGMVVGVEALARLIHPSKGVLLPEHFPTILAAGDGADLLNQLMFERVFEDMARWEHQGAAVPVAVNVSAATLDDLSIPDQLAKAADRFAIPLDLITIELTETSYSDEMLQILDVFTRLRLKGIGLSIDDFGTGYSTRERLADLPFTELKIDRSLIHALGNEAGAIDRIKRCLVTGNQLGLSVVAEGVETTSHIETVRNLGIDLVQGYAVAKPMPAREVVAWVNDYLDQNFFAVELQAVLP
ncbi:MAG: EAL domain-containing response regulator [Pseudomonadota bacterium]